MRDVRMMTSLLVVAALVVRGRLLVVTCGMLVVLCGLLVMVCAQMSRHVITSQM